MKCSILFQFIDDIMGSESSVCLRMDQILSKKAEGKIEKD